MSRKYRRLRIPPTGTPLFVVVETKTGWVIKAPGLSERDHVTLVKEADGVSKHLTDEHDFTPGRYLRLGKMTRGTTRPELQFYEGHLIEINESEEIYAFDVGLLFRGRAINAGDVPDGSLEPNPSDVAFLRKGDLAAMPLFRRMTFREAKTGGFVGGFRREGDENVAILRMASGEFIRLSVSELFGLGAEAARVVGVGALMARAMHRRKAQERS